MTLIMSVICLLFGLVAFVLGFAMCYVRAWQIYIYAAFSPIPISLLGFEETRQMGIGVPEELRVRLSGRGDPAVPVRGLPIRARGIGVKPQRGQ